MQLGGGFEICVAPDELQSLFCWKFVCNSDQIRSDHKSCSPCFAGSSYATLDLVSFTKRIRSCSPCFAGSLYATAENLLRFDKYLSIWLQ